MNRLNIWFLAAVFFALVGMAGGAEEVRPGQKVEKVRAAFEVRRFVVSIPGRGGAFDQNVYLLFDKVFKQGLIIDPGVRSQELEAIIVESGVTIKGVLNTHGHYDHAGANGYYRDRYQVAVYAHGGDKSLYKSKNNEPANWLQADGVLSVGGVEVQVIHTPGHSPGSVCFLAGEHLFSGDTLFQASIGRTPNEEADRELVEFAKKKLLTLPPETWVYPGHGDSTTIGAEKKENPYLQND